MDKKCCRCKEIKPESEFYRNRHFASGLSYECRQCKQEYQRGIYDKSKGKYNYSARYRSRLLLKYGITPEDYDAIFSSQRGRCAICGRHQSDLIKALFVDHDHQTGRVRGLLCYKCNTAIGQIENGGIDAFINYLLDKKEL